MGYVFILNAIFPFRIRPTNKPKVQRHVETTWHSLGTCSMAPREGSSIAKHGGVVDERLNVYGVKGLKVCDLSICPDNVGCNTFSVSPSSPSPFAQRSMLFWGRDKGH